MTQPFNLTYNIHYLRYQGSLTLGTLEDFTVSEEEFFNYFLFKIREHEKYIQIMSEVSKQTIEYYKQTLLEKDVQNFSFSAEEDQAFKNKISEVEKKLLTK